jgi:phosphoenolpyruvate-protein kinase (PTS system EI component)
MKIKIKGIAVSSGIAIGSAYIYINSIPSVQTRPIEDSSEELERLESAFENLEQHLAENKIMYPKN